MNFVKGQVIFSDFLDSLDDAISFNRSIKKDGVDFFRQQAPAASIDTKQVLKEDCRLFSQLFIYRANHEKIQTYLTKYEQTDIVFDVYWTPNLKDEIRLKQR